MGVPGEKGWPEEMTRQSQGDTRIFHEGWWDSGSRGTGWSRKAAAHVIQKTGRVVVPAAASLSLSCLLRGTHGSGLSSVCPG